MKHFHYQITEFALWRRSTIWLSVICIILVPLMIRILLMEQSGMSVLIAKAFLVAMSLSVIYSVYRYREICKYDHGWDIVISDESIRWSAPPKTSKFYERSFEFDISEVDRLIRVYNRRSEEHDYSLVLKNNCRMEITNNFGMNMVEFYQALEKVGIPMETSHEEN